MQRLRSVKLCFSTVCLFESSAARLTSKKIPDLLKKSVIKSYNEPQPLVLSYDAFGETKQYLLFTFFFFFWINHFTLTIAGVKLPPSYEHIVVQSDKYSAQLECLLFLLSSTDYFKIHVVFIVVHYVMLVPGTGSKAILIKMYALVLLNACLRIR